MKIAVTGRRYPTPRSILLIRQAMSQVVANPEVTDVYFGGAFGVDTEALNMAARYVRGGRVKLHAILPGVLQDLGDHQKAALDLADTVTELAGDMSTSTAATLSFLARNRHLVDCSDKVLAFWDNKKEGGTWHAIEYARKTGKEVKPLLLQAYPTLSRGALLREIEAVLDYPGAEPPHAHFLREASRHNGPAWQKSWSPEHTRRVYVSILGAWDSLCPMPALTPEPTPLG